MPTFPLFDPAPPHPDGWHNVISPGGYEWWYFDAEDVESDRQIVAIFFQGFVFHPGYLRAEARFRRNPTRVPPPIAADFPCAYFVVYEKGKVRKQFLTQVPPTDFEAARDRLQVRIGANRIDAENGAIQLQLTGAPWTIGTRGPALIPGETLAAQFEFISATTRSIETRVFLSKAMTDADHRWHIANPLCSVTGSIQLEGETISFNGRGYHDHNYGNAPLGRGLHRWMWGRVLRDDAACVFHVAEPRDANKPPEIHLIQIDEDLVKDEAIAECSPMRFRRTTLGLAYPFELRLGTHLALRRPRLIDSSPFYLRLQYAAEWNGVTSPAFCEIAYPHRLHWPVLGRMIEMSIDRSMLV